MRDVDGVPNQSHHGWLVLVLLHDVSSDVFLGHGRVLDVNLDRGVEHRLQVKV